MPPMRESSRRSFLILPPGFDTLCKRVKKSLQEAARELKEAADKARGKAEIVEARIDVLEEELDWREDRRSSGGRCA